MDILLQISVYLVIGILLIGIAMPLWVPIMNALLQLFASACELYARYEAWRDRNHATPR